MNALVHQYLDDVKNNVEKGWPQSSYALSKLFLTTYTTLLANSNAYKDKKVTKIALNELKQQILINATCPGYVNTELSKGLGTLTVEQGAETPIYAALLPPDSQLHGVFLSEKTVKGYDDIPKLFFTLPSFQIPK